MNLVIEALVVMTLDPLINLDTNIDIGETQVNLQRIITPTTTNNWPNMIQILTTRQLANTYDVKHIHNPKSGQDRL